MLKVLLVDDELIVRKGLKAIVDWQDFGMEVEAEASNGQRAIEMLYELQQIDLIITDIRMPVLDGLELTRMVRTSHPHTKVLLLTCYNDFEYVKEALELGASGYLLKTDLEDDGHLEKALRKIRSELVKEREKQKEYELLQHYAEKSLPLLREKWLKSLVSGEDLCSITDQMLSLNLEWVHHPHLLCRMDFADVSPSLGGSVESLSLELLGHDSIILSMEYSSFLLLLRPRPEISEYRRIQWEKQVLAEWRSRMEKKCGKDVNVYYGRSTGLDRFATVYDQLSRIGEYYTFYHGYGALIDIGSFPQTASLLETGHLDLVVLNELKQMVIIRNWDHVKRILSDLKETVLRVKPSVDTVKNFIVELVMTLIEGLQSNSHIISTIWGTNKFDYIDKVKGMNTLAEIVEWIFTGVDQIEGERSVFVGGENRVIMKAVEYIENHFHQDLTLEDLSAHVGLSKSYLSSTFKKVCGESFIEYLIRVRIQKAETMLRQTDLKIYQVAESVGFQDPKYFTKLFKKMTGISPNQYKDKVEC